MQLRDLMHAKKKSPHNSETEKVHVAFSST